MVALLHESDLVLSDEYVEQIVNQVKIDSPPEFSDLCDLHIQNFLSSPQTFNDADSNGDGKIDPEEWKEFVSKNPSLIKNMTLPYLKWVLNITCNLIVDLNRSVSCLLFT